MRIKTGVLIFLTSMLLFSLILFVKPPFSSPDEGFHLSRADGILQGYFVLKPISSDGSSGAEVDNSLDKIAKLYHSTLSTPYPSELNYSLEQMKHLKWSHTYFSRGMPNVTFYTPSVYLPQALGFAISKALDFNIYSSYLLTNIITFSVCLILLISAYYIHPIPLLTLTFLIIPMSVFQLMSPTIDGLSMASTVLAMSCFMRLLTDKDLKYYNWLALLMSLCIFSAAGSRANLLLMSLLPLWLFYKNKKKSNLIFLVFCIVTTLSWTAYNLLNVQDAAMGRHPGYTNSELIIFYLKHPIVFIKIFLNTITDVSMLNFYLTSMIGKLGWLDAPISQSGFLFFFLVIVVAIVSSIISFKKTRDKSTSLFIFLLSLFSILLIFPALLAQWNTFPTDKIIGVQGRYFIIPVLILGYCFHTHKTMRPKELLLLGAILLVSTYSVYSAINKHYNNPSFTFQTIDPALTLKKSIAVNLSENPARTYNFAVPDGNIRSVLVFFGNYSNKSRGTVSLEICSLNTCQKSLVNISEKSDNSYYEFDLPKKLTVKNKKITMRLNFYKDKDALPLAIWEYGSTSESTSLTPRVKFNYIN